MGGESEQYTKPKSRFGHGTTPFDLSLKGPKAADPDEAAVREQVRKNRVKEPPKSSTPQRGGATPHTGVQKPSYAFERFIAKGYGLAGGRKMTTKGARYTKGFLKGETKGSGYEKMRTRFKRMSPEARAKYGREARMDDVTSPAEKAQTNAYRAQESAKANGSTTPTTAGATAAAPKPKMRNLGRSTPGHTNPSSGSTGVSRVVGSSASSRMQSGKKAALMGRVGAGSGGSRKASLMKSRGISGSGAAQKQKKAALMAR